jgi:hypothetical protein
MRGWWRARWAESRPDLPGRLDGRDKEPGGASRQPLREKSLRGRAGTSGGRGRGVDREFEAIRAAGPEGSLRRPGHGSSRRGVSPGSDGNSTARSGPRRAPSAAPAPEARDGGVAPGRTGIRGDWRGGPGEIAPPRRPRKLGTGSQLWVGREFKAIGAAGPEKSLRRAGPEARDGGVSLGSDENSRRICGGPGGIAPPRRTGNPGRDESALRRTGIRNGGCGEHAKKIAPAVLRPRCDRVRVQFGCS